MRISALAALTLTLASLVSRQVQAQIYDTNGDFVQTFAGSGEQGLYDGQGVLTKFSNPTQICADTASNLYVWDSGNYAIRKITPNATVSTLAGIGTNTQGWGTNVSFLYYTSVGSMVIDHSNTLWLVATGSDEGIVTPYLLNIQTNGWVSIQNSGAVLSNLSTGVSRLCFDSANNLYYTGAERVWRYNPSIGVAQPFCGNGTLGDVDGTGTVFTELHNPEALACDQANNIYVSEDTGCIRRIDQTQTVTTIAGLACCGEIDGSGTNTSFGGAIGIDQMTADGSGNIYMACGYCVRKMDAQTNVITMAGSFSQTGYTNGPGNLAQFYYAEAVCLSQGMIFVADTKNQRIRNITFNPTTQIVSPANLKLNTYPGLQITGTVGRTYQIQTSPDLSNWTTRTTLLLTSSPYFWLDQNPISGNQFYRALLLP